MTGTAAGAGHTDVGRVRKLNEDAHLIDAELGLFIVSDGMGGHAAGEVASATAVRTVHETVAANRGLLEDVAVGEVAREALTELATRAARAACEAVHTLARSDVTRADMGCTLTVLIISGGVGAMAHIGDSRLYLLRNDEIRQLSQDHTMLAELMRAGHIPEGDPSEHPYAGILSRAVGPQPSVDVDTLLIELVSGDHFLLCSDGFSNHLPPAAHIIDVVQSSELPAAAARLVEHANTAGGNDNITVVLVSVGEQAATDVSNEDLEERFQALTAVSFFEELDLRFVGRLMSVCEVAEHEAGDVVVAEGDPLNDLVVVVSGSYVARHAGLDHAVVGAGDHAGESFLLHERPARASLVAATRSVMLRLRSARFRQLCRARPWFGISLLEQLGRRLCAAHDESLDAQPRPSDDASARCRWRGNGLTRRGRARRANTDRSLVDDTLGLYVVCDGGATPAGSDAADEALRVIGDVIRSEGASTPTDEAVALLRCALHDACVSIYERAHTVAGRAGMGCTVTALWVRDETAVVAHVGNGRCYLVRNGTATLLTVDHTVGADLVRAGLATKEEAAANASAHVLSRMVGTHEAVRVDAFDVGLLADDSLLLCTDGMKQPSNSWLFEHLDAGLHELVRQAALASDDDITAVWIAAEAILPPALHDTANRCLEALAGVSLFADLSAGHLSRILSHAEIRHLADGEILLERGATCASLIIVVEGELARAGAPLTNGQHIGITTLVSPQPAACSLVAAGATTVLSLPRAAFWRLVRQRPHVGVTLLERLVEQLVGTPDARFVSQRSALPDPLDPGP